MGITENPSGSRQSDDIRIQFPVCFRTQRKVRESFKRKMSLIWGIGIWTMESAMRAMNSILFSLLLVAALPMIGLALTHQSVDQGLALITLFGTTAVLGAALALSFSLAHHRRSITIGGVFVAAR